MLDFYGSPGGSDDDIRRSFKENATVHGILRNFCVWRPSLRHVCGLTLEGDIRCWGRGMRGETEFRAGPWYQVFPCVHSSYSNDATQAGELHLLLGYVWFGQPVEIDISAKKLLVHVPVLEVDVLPRRCRRRVCNQRPSEYLMYVTYNTSRGSVTHPQCHRRKSRVLNRESRLFHLAFQLVADKYMFPHSVCKLAGRSFHLWRHFQQSSFLLLILGKVTCGQWTTCGIRAGDGGIECWGMSKVRKCFRAHRCWYLASRNVYPVAFLGGAAFVQSIRRRTPLSLSLAVTNEATSPREKTRNRP